MASSSTFRAARVRRLILHVITALCVFFVLAPLVVVILNSFSSVSYNKFPPPGFSLKWYENIFQVPEFGNSAVYSLVLAALSTVLATVIGAMASYAFVRGRLFAKGLISGAILASLVVPKIVLGVGLFVFFAKIGGYGQLWSVVVSHAVISLPFVVTLVSAAMVGLDRSLEEASRDLGASPFTTFRQIVLPQIRVSITVGALFAFIVSFDQLESTIFLLKPGTETLPIALFNYTIKHQDPTVAALSSLMILFSVALVIVAAVLLKRGNAMEALRRTQESQK
ncbi:ABC transporter permease [Actinomadura soli]|uniref:ABC transporter permease n=1 Tax=Actinomadura soli TaxID=2508997 RepID=A0A5C4JJ41_9ACTN|nr:ABC transporter permease [Actinomadura soli]TMR05009.1 ABC transporter permease [Actinomadura soli]